MRVVLWGAYTQIFKRFNNLHKRPLAKSSAGIVFSGLGRFFKRPLDAVMWFPDITSLLGRNVTPRFLPEKIAKDRQFPKPFKIREEFLDDIIPLDKNCILKAIVLGIG